MKRGKKGGFEIPDSRGQKGRRAEGKRAEGQ
jgi:hypothetical protein